MRHLVPVLLILSLLVACKRGEKPVSSTTTTDTQPPSKKPQPPVPATVGTEIGQTMPGYDASRLDGSPFSLASERGNVVLLNLWATWCGPCRVEIPELQTLHDRYAARGFKVVGVSVDESGADVVKSFVEEQKMTYPVVLDPDGKLAGVLNTQVLPTTVLLDRQGTIVWKNYGQVQITDPKLVAALEKSLPVAP